MKKEVRGMWDTIVLPFVIIKLRIIQERYKYFSLKKDKKFVSKLIVLQAKEEYYKYQFEATGKYYGFKRQPMTVETYMSQQEWIEFLFPPKSFFEIQEVKDCSRENVKFLQDQIRKTEGLALRSAKMIM